MTTIAFDGKTIASDSLGVCGTLKGEESKLFRIEAGVHYAIGGAGTWYRILHLVRWLDLCLRDDCHGDPETWKPWPHYKGDSDDPNAILVALSGEFAGQSWRLEGDLFVRNDGPAACGSGAFFALAAMHCGKTAAEAVEVASAFDIYTGGRVDTIACQGVTTP